MHESVRENPRRSISHRSQELGLSATSTWRILRRDLNLHPYKIQLTQQLKITTIDNAVCSLIGFWSSWKLTQISSNKSSLAMRPIFGWMDMWTSKIVKFGTISIHARYPTSKCKSRENHCLVRRNHPHFFQIEAGVAITVNGERYRSMISNFLWPKMDDMDTNNKWFQQDGATCHDGHSARAIWGHGYLARRRRELATEMRAI